MTWPNQSTAASPATFAVERSSENDIAEPDASANAGSPPRLHFNTLVPAWLRFTLGNKRPH